MTVVTHIGATLYCRFLINNHLCRLHHSGACLNNNNEKLPFLFFCLAISCPATWSAIFSHRDPDYSLSVRHCYLTFAEHKKDTVSVKKTCTTYPQATSFKPCSRHMNWTVAVANGHVYSPASHHIDLLRTDWLKTPRTRSHSSWIPVGAVWMFPLASMQLWGTGARFHFTFSCTKSDSDCPSIV